MQHHSNISVGALVALISFLHWFNWGPQTYAQTNESAQDTTSLTSQYTTGEGATARTIEEQLELAKEKIANARQAGVYGPPTSSMNFDMFMSSFANSIFNGTSIFGGVGTSMVNGVRVSGIGLDKSGSQLSVTLSGAPTEVIGLNNTAGTRNDTMVTTTTNFSNSVSLIAMRIPINMADILSLAAAASSSQDMTSDLVTGNMNFSVFLVSTHFHC